MSNKEYKRKFKPWLTTGGILNSISRKNKIYISTQKSRMTWTRTKFLKNINSYVIRSMS